MRFSDILITGSTREALINAVKQNRVPHALLFHGQAGVPNLPAAVSFLNYLYCKNPGAEDSCGECSSCRKTKKLIHPDIGFIFPIVKSGTGKNALSENFIEKWRSFLTTNSFPSLTDWLEHLGADTGQPNIPVEESRNLIKNLSLKPFESDKKAVIIWLPELMHPATANALLKLTEEPSPGTIIILVSDNLENLPVTLVSRTQPVNITIPKKDEIKNYLITKYNAGTEAAERAALSSGGNINLAIKLIEGLSEDSNLLEFSEWMRFCYAKNFTELVNAAEKFQNQPKIDQKNFFRYASTLLHEALLEKHIGHEGNDDSSTETNKFLINFSKHTSDNQLLKLAEEFDNAQLHLERNANPKIIFLDTSLRTTEIFAE